MSRLGVDWDDAAEGRSRALRRMPRHWHLETTEHDRAMARRRFAWWCIRWSLIFGLGLIAYIAMAKEMGVL